MSFLINNLDRYFNSLERGINNLFPTGQNINNNRENKRDNILLNDLPVFRYRKIDKIKSKSCPICLEDYKEDDFIPYFHCEHYFHYKCFKECLITNSNTENNKEFTCPVCRQKIMNQNFVNKAKKKRKEFIDRTYAI